MLASVSLLLAGSAFSAEKGVSGPIYNSYGGPAYTGPQDLDLLAALVQAGGGADHFSLTKALTQMLGTKALDNEVHKLTMEYGKRRVAQWGTGFKFAVDRTLYLMKREHIELPSPVELAGPKLAKALIAAGTAPDHVFWTGRLFDHILSHNIHNQIMLDTNKKYGHDYDQNYHKISNQSFYDIAHAWGLKDVKLASLHRAAAGCGSARRRRVASPVVWKQRARVT